MFVVKRSHHNPVLIPQKYHPWEAMAAFNWCPIKKGKKTYAVYRAAGMPSLYEGVNMSLSTIGLASWVDETHITERRQFIFPENGWERYGCEDPRITFFEGKYYIFYTALSNYPFNADSIKIALATTKDLKKIDEKHLITPFNAKAMALFPERINGKMAAILTVDTDRSNSRIAIAMFDKDEDLYSKDFWDKWYSELDHHSIEEPRRSLHDFVEVGAPPIKTPYGWLQVYSHIQNYFQTAEKIDRVFGVEVLLLDLENPQKIIGRTRGPLLAPTEEYEQMGIVPNVAFPSGAYIEKKNLFIFYGSADTTGSIARVRLSDLIGSILPQTTNEYHFKRYEKNPILEPRPELDWESRAVFNAGAIYLGGKAHIIYRAMSQDNTSVLGYANSKNCLDIDERLDEPVYVPREDFEIKKNIGGNSGCEDPRIMKIGDRIYMCYTAFDGINQTRVAVSSISEKDFLKKNWNWSKPILITPKGLNDKNACIFPEKINGKYMILHRLSNDICADYLGSLEFGEYNQITKCIKILGPRPYMWDGEKVGITAPPIKTSKGWLLIYHGVSKHHPVYRIGAVLLDLKDPTVIVSRLTDPIFEPETLYELEGQINNVVFVCGLVVKKGIIYIYYGAADTVIGVATLKLDNLMKSLTAPFRK